MAYRRRAQGARSDARGRRGPDAEAHTSGQGRPAADRDRRAASVTSISDVPSTRCSIMSSHSRQPEDDELVPARPSRAVMYALVSLQGLPNWVIRNGSESWKFGAPGWPRIICHHILPIFTRSVPFVFSRSAPSWVPFVVADMRLSDADRALLLAAWFPGYLVSQIPGAALIDRIGPKIVMGLNMLGTCGLFLLLPVFVRIGGGGQISRQVRIMASTLTVCGFFQGPLIPGQQVMRYVESFNMAIPVTGFL